MEDCPDMHGIRLRRSHSTPDPEDAPPGAPGPGPVPDDVPSPAHAPVQEPDAPAPPVKQI